MLNKQLNKKYIILLSFAISIILSVGDFMFFKISKNIAFKMHNSLAIGVGVGLILCSYKLLCSDSKYKYSLYISMIIGFAMIIIHITKLSIGVCV